MQNTALRTESGCTEDINIEHLDDETQTLPLTEHFKLHASQIKQKAQHPGHPQNRQPRLMKQVTFNNTNYTTNIQADPNTVTIADISTNKKTIHQAIVTKHVTKPLLQNSSSKEITTKYCKHFHPTSAVLKRHYPSSRVVP